MRARVAPVGSSALKLSAKQDLPGGWEAGGFAQKLAYVYARKMDVINRGLGGYNSEWGIPAFEQMFTKDKTGTHPKCKLLTIWFGANDACLPFSNQHVPLDKYQQNLTWMVQALRTPSSEYYAPWTRIILLTPPPIQVDAWAQHIAERDPPKDMDRTWENTKAYADAAKEVARELRVPVVDAWDAIWKAAGEETLGLTRFLSDGLHLTREGYEVVYNELIKVIEKEYPELHYDKLPLILPAWDTVDPKNPRASVVSHYVDV
ncbi:hypothetical protein PIIN_04571 [Serendipita indica DSM 11827]|uniref:SGNH hydrolase-type esterase domain-containing protein n=1 Tax=Serendipita indica (strain DSM 11827) TaxID=1109443 RepID=G4TH52_SERID|nr:hypothetical protein PIIN_04571 [Serendipita indica DSM 11827]